MTTKQKVEQIVEFCDDMKAERIETLEVRGKTSVTDFMVVCSGNSQVHAEAIAERVIEKTRAIGIKPLRKKDPSGKDGWTLVDFGDVILHVMLEEKRQYYDLESLWNELPLDDTLLVTDEDSPAS